jgi:hypothetical protein
LFLDGPRGETDVLSRRSVSYANCRLRRRWFSDRLYGLGGGNDLYAPQP